MNDKIYVIPTKDMKVRDPQRGDHLPAEGREVRPSTYWLRREKEGGITIGKKPAPQKKAKSDTATSSSDS